MAQKIQRCETNTALPDYDPIFFYIAIPSFYSKREKLKGLKEDFLGLFCRKGIMYSEDYRRVRWSGGEHKEHS